MEADLPRNSTLELAKLLVQRLERLSADSYWAHRASGLRGSLLRTLDKFEQESNISLDASQNSDLEHLEQLIWVGFDFLEKAAREIT